MERGRDGEREGWGERQADLDVDIPHFSCGSACRIAMCSVRLAPLMPIHGFVKEKMDGRGVSRSKVKGSVGVEGGKV
jgi:hypothetical protein